MQSIQDQDNRYCKRFVVINLTLSAQNEMKESTQINIRENRRDNQEWTIQRNW